MPIKERARRILWPLVSLRRLFLKKNSYLYNTGWHNSVKHSKPITKDGECLPWMNYPLISFLDERLNKSIVMFEFGSGFSTIYFASKVKEITSIEYDLEWYKKMRESCPKNAKTEYTPVDKSGSYSKSVKKSHIRYDIIVVDGRDRVDCFKEGITQLTDRGVIILDDSQRIDYSESFEHSKRLGFRHINFEGLKPTGFEVERTTIFYKDGNCLGI